MLKRNRVNDLEAGLRQSVNAWGRQAGRGLPEYRDVTRESGGVIWVLEPDTSSGDGFKLLIKDSSDSKEREPTAVELAEYQMAITLANGVPVRH